MKNTQKKSEVESGDELTMLWEPYAWAKEKYGFSGSESVKVTHVMAGGDIRVLTTQGRALSVETNGYVTTGESPFDKGRFVGFK